MEINAAMAENLSSLKQSIGIATLRQSMNQDAASVAILMKGMAAASAKLMESSVTPHLGSTIDTRI